MTELMVPSRFRGPAKSGNGGWTAGSLAALAEVCPRDHADNWPAVQVTLRMPPPLDVELPVTSTATSASCEVGEAVVVDRDPVIVDPVPLEEARAAEATYPGLTFHPFPTCFACGTGREPGDGLRIFPGRVGDAPDGSQRVAATWTPDPSVAENFHEYVDTVPRASLPVTWAALDCVGGWAGDLTDRLMVLGRMTALVDALPAIGETHVVVGQRLGSEGRKTFTAATLYDADERIVARAEHTWIAVDPAAFNG
ncbi:conserved hypothetical protein [metagenome]|uniref:Uncharacterized protein n=1 Tax=metagenome TaxID=256318 RepID=A0A2P2C5Z1_9ZZZZ